MPRTSIFFKAAVLAAALALAFSSIAFAKHKVEKAPAAPAAAPQQASAQILQNTWKAELGRLNIDNVILGRLDRMVNDVLVRFDKDLNIKHADREHFTGRLEFTFNEIQVLLGKAEATAKTHAGFDANGNVTDQAQALKTVQTLGAYLSQLRGTLVFRLEHLMRQ